jgi:hypothetical protein
LFCEVNKQIFGGYTSTLNENTSDEDKTAFLFSITKREKINQKIMGAAIIHNDENNLIVFGPDGKDLDSADFAIVSDDY